MYVGALHVAPQLVDSLKPIWLHEVPSFDTSCHTATRWPAPALATTGKARPVSWPESLARTGTLVNVRPPLVEKAKFTPPDEVEYTKPTLPAVRDVPSAIRLPGGQTQPVWSSGVAATTCCGYTGTPPTDRETTSPLGIWWVRW